MEGGEGSMESPKTRDRLPSSWVESDDESPAEWTDLEENGDDAESESESSP